MNDTKTMDFNQLDAEVVSRDLCTRCGICAGVCPVQVIAFNESGFPELAGDCIACNNCNACCPGADVDFHKLSEAVFGQKHNPENLQGYVEQQFVGYANEDFIRKSGSSGGVITAILLHLLETGKILGAIVTAWDNDDPLKIRGFLAKSPDEIRKAAGSKYCLTPAMEKIHEIRNLPGRYAVVALPCQIQGLRKMKQVEPELSEKIYCILGLLCHNNMNPEVIHACLQSKRIPAEDVHKFSFRGDEWPGKMQVETNDKSVKTLFPVSLHTIINLLFRLFGAERCFVCQDPMAEFADLSFGDFWAGEYEGPLAELKASTLIYQRTTQGKVVLDDAAEHGAVVLTPLEEKDASQRILNMARGKKTAATKFIAFRRLKGVGVPQPVTHSREQKLFLGYRIKSWIFHLFRNTRLKQFTLAIYASPAGVLVDWLTRFGKFLFLGIRNR
jgi:coenzyme F420 hydrogenase subunit beta